VAQRTVIISYPLAKCDKLGCVSHRVPFEKARCEVEQDEKSYKIPWYCNVGLFIFFAVPAVLILTAGWFLGVLVEALL